MKTTHILNTAIVAGAALLSLAPSLKAQTTIAGWNFESPLTQAPNSNPAPSTNNSAGAVSAACIGMTLAGGAATNSPDITLGVTGDTGTNGFANTTQLWRIRSGVTGTNGWTSAAPIGTQGAQFNVDTTGFSSIQISFDWYSTKRGEANLQLEYTTDGSTWINTPITIPSADLLPSGTLTSVTNGGSDANAVTGTYIHGFGGTTGQEWFPNLTATVSDPSAANDPNFGIRIVNATTGSTDDVDMTGTALNNTSGNWRFDNVSVSGTSAVPEPASAVAILGGLGMLLGFGKVRRGNRKA